MKRYNNLYNNICKYENIKSAYKEVCRNTKNKRRIKDKDALKIVFDIIDSNSPRPIYRVHDKSSASHLLPKRHGSFY